LIDRLIDAMEAMAERVNNTQVMVGCLAEMVGPTLMDRAKTDSRYAAAVDLLALAAAQGRKAGEKQLAAAFTAEALDKAKKGAQ
jgi:hypothetical protein